RGMARAVQRVAVESPARTDFQPAVRAALLRQFGEFLTETGFELRPSVFGRRELGVEAAEGAAFLWWVGRHGPPGRRGVDAVAGRCLTRARAEARQTMAETLQAVRQGHQWRNEPRAEAPADRPERTGWRALLARLFPSPPAPSPSDDAPPDG